MFIIPTFLIWVNLGSFSTLETSAVFVVVPGRGGAGGAVLVVVPGRGGGGGAGALDTEVEDMIQYENIYFSRYFRESTTNRYEIRYSQ